MVLGQYFHWIIRFINLVLKANKNWLLLRNIYHQRHLSGPISYRDVRETGSCTARQGKVWDACGQQLRLPSTFSSFNYPRWLPSILLLWQWKSAIFLVNNCKLTCKRCLTRFRDMWKQKRSNSNQESEAYDIARGLYDSKGKLIWIETHIFLFSFHQSMGILQNVE